MLTIYSASAGTGKTHTLTGEYLSLLFNGKEQHRHVLGVTFTNKATAEMKSRILEELFRLADNQFSHYLDLLSESGKRSEPEIRMQAKKILLSILHDYSAFNISTIDHFFQHTLRAFTRELGLQGNYQIELDEELMLEKAVEIMFSELEKNENKALMDWLLKFTEDKIEESGRWDIRNDIIQLGKQLFKETYKTYSHQIQEEVNQKQFLSDYRTRLYQIIQSTRTAAGAFGEKGMLLMQQHGMQPADFKGGSRSVFFYFERLAAGEMIEIKDTFRALLDNVEGYLAKTATAEKRLAAERIYANGMNELIRNTLSFFDNLTDYYTALEIVRNFYTLGILTDLSQHVAKWREENNKMLIADTTELLHNVIDGSEIPFIYEKTGTRIAHYMIDEFQDTSGMQWSNFRPLLKDSLDSGRANLIVGDVKQSIYRFRNSDWTLLDRQVKVDFQNRAIEKNLDVNWRSCRHIVQFNNMLFNAVPLLLQQSYNDDVGQSSLSEEEKERHQALIVSAYKNAEQRVADSLADKDGHVRIRFLADEEEQSWKQQSMEQLPRTVEQLQHQGYNLRDIAILTRTGAEGLLAAETLLAYKESHPESSYKYDIISEDSLTVNSSLSVRWMVEMIRYLSRPDIKSNQERAQVTYAVLKQKKQAPVEVSAINACDRPFPPEVISQLRRLSGRSLYELTEGLFRLFEADFPENELVFIQAFLDMAAEYAARETADTERFLTWWDETGCRKKIITPDSQNAIRILTIHKSKGLGFKVVIMPFADWKIDQKEAILWCHPTRKPFNQLSLVPVKYSKALRNTIFAPDYFKEKLHACMDNLNALYVAFTRAKEELIVWSPRPKTEAVTTIANLLWNGLMTDPHFPLDEESGLYERGLGWTPTAEKTPAETEEWPMERFYSFSPDERMLLRLHRKNGFFEDEKRKYGLLMHDLLSRIEKQDDIPRALSEKQATGEISGEEAVLLKEQLLSLTSGEEVRSWFDGSMQVMTEAEILFRKGQSCRPDRIMMDKNNRIILIDYKFGTQKETTHRRQIEKYSALIHEMGYPDVAGFLWYFSLGEIEKCFFQV